MKTVLKKCFRFAVYVAAILFAFQTLIALIGVPKFVSQWFAGKDLLKDDEPGVIIVLGGGGIPSQSGLIRTYYAAQYAKERPWVRTIISLPARDNPYEGDVGKMRDELVMRGVHPETIALEIEARNTYEQAVEIRAMLDDETRRRPVMIVTSPYHLRRSIRCFEKQGFTHLVGLAAAGTGVDADVGGGTAWRYGFWQTWEYQVRLVREVVAMGYYSAKGWI